jgi:hypothetical protein
MDDVDIPADVQVGGKPKLVVSEERMAGTIVSPEEVALIVPAPVFEARFRPIGVRSSLYHPELIVDEVVLIRSVDTVHIDCRYRSVIVVIVPFGNRVAVTRGRAGRGRWTSDLEHEYREPDRKKGSQKLPHGRIPLSR